MDIVYKKQRKITKVERIDRKSELSNACNSIGNGFPMQKYVGAMVRVVIRVTIAAENDVLEVASDSVIEQLSLGA